MLCKKFDDSEITIPKRPLGESHEGSAECSFPAVPSKSPGMDEGFWTLWTRTIPSLEEQKNLPAEPCRISETLCP